MFFNFFVSKIPFFFKFSTIFQMGKNTFLTFERGQKFGCDIILGGGGAGGPITVARCDEAGGGSSKSPKIASRNLWMAPYRTTSICLVPKSVDSSHFFGIDRVLQPRLLVSNCSKNHVVTSLKYITNIRGKHSKGTEFPLNKFWLRLQCKCRSFSIPACSGSFGVF